MSIRTRLAVWYSVLVLVILSLIAAIRYTSQKELLLGQKDYSLKVVGDILDASLPSRPVNREDVQKAASRIVKDYPDIEFKGTLIEVYDPARRLIYSSSIGSGERLPVSPETWIRALRGERSLQTLALSPDTAAVRVLTRPVFDRRDLVFLIQVGRSMQDVESSLDTFLLLNFLLIPVTALLVGAGGWLLIRRTLRPLETVVQTAHRIGSGDLHHRIEVPSPSREIQDLMEAFNHMITRLEASFRQTREFSDNVSHELRIPLAILKGQTELSLRRERPSGDYRDVLKSNLEEIDRMEKIVERLLFLSRARRGEIAINRAPVDLNRMLESIQAQFQEAARRKNIALTYQPNGAVSVMGDEVLLREVMLNLLQNAVAHTPEGGEVRLGPSREEREIRISVADTGIGIPEGEIPRLFERFYQVDKSRSSQGSGLGLSLCQWIVMAHQGRIEVESRPGLGSRFTVCLPAED
ncbi:MAG TPA: heavy metal sensor histidine kinase [Nitrospiria bacterium]